MVNVTVTMLTDPWLDLAFSYAPDRSRAALGALALIADRRLSGPVPPSFVLRLALLPDRQIAPRWRDSGFSAFRPRSREVKGGTGDVATSCGGDGRNFVVGGGDDLAGDAIAARDDACRHAGGRGRDRGDVRIWVSDPCSTHLVRSDIDTAAVVLCLKHLHRGLRHDESDGAPLR